MRYYREPTCANFLKEPLVLGVGLLPLLLLLFFITLAQVAGLTYVAMGLAALGYLALRLQARFGKNGAEESLIYFFERRLVKTVRAPLPSWLAFQLQSPDTMDTDSQLTEKEQIEDRLRELRPGESRLLPTVITERGARRTGFLEGSHVYSLYRLPSHTDPLWISSQLKKVRNAEVLIRLDGVDQRKIKRMAERARRQNFEPGLGVASIDSAVSFEESSEILEGIARGTEEVVRISMIIASPGELDLDPDYFCKEKDVELPFYAIRGIRARPHRAHYVRLPTASDLVPTFFDPEEKDKKALFRSRRDFPLYFTPLDPGLDSFHLLISGATGAGKSFFTGLVFKRLIEQGENISVLFLDHRRSYRRLCQRHGEGFLEPDSLADLKRQLSLQPLAMPRRMLGVELSDLLEEEKKAATCHILEQVETFLKTRDSNHLLYVVLDECWKQLQDEPLLIQRTFREYRKLRGAVCAVTQSVHDALKTENGGIFLQCAPTRVLLRQGEDMLPLQSGLDLNAVELKEVKRLRQKKGEFSECLIKTPFLSTLARLYPTPEEFALLQTDNFKE